MRHPLIDRHDLTAQRDAEQLERAHPHETEGGAMLALAEQIGGLRRLMEQLLQQERAELPQLCVSDLEPAESEMRDFPVPRACRYLVRRTGNGGTVNLAGGTPTQLLRGNEARLGGTIIVSGAAPVVLYLTSDLAGTGGTPLTEGVAQIYLAAGGGSWDFRLGDALWCGSITAIAAGATSVSVAEV